MFVLLNSLDFAIPVCLLGLRNLSNHKIKARKSVISNQTLLFLNKIVIRPTTFYISKVVGGPCLSHLLLTIVNSYKFELVICSDF